MNAFVCRIANRIQRDCSFCKYLHTGMTPTTGHSLELTEVHVMERQTVLYQYSRGYLNECLVEYLTQPTVWERKRAKGQKVLKEQYIQQKHVLGIILTDDEQERVVLLTVSPLNILRTRVGYRQ